MRAVAFSSGRQGRIAKLDGSGIAIMSDSSIGLKPVIEEPSKPIPPSNASSSSEALIENDFSWPSTSVNQRRMKRTSCSRDRRDHVVGGLRPLVWSDIGAKVIRDGSAPY